MKTEIDSCLCNEEHQYEIDVVVLYDDLAAGRWAGETISSVSDSQRDNICFRLKPWRLDFLNDPEWTTVACAEAAQAQLLFVSLSRIGNITHKVENWLRAWMRDKQGRDAAIVLMAEDTKEKSGSPIAILKDLAINAGVNFFSVRPPRTGNSIRASQV